MSAKVGTGVEFPSRDKLAIYGDFLFLTLRSQRHAAMTMAVMRESMEPPIELGQFRIFRFDDIPRGLFTWARLDAEAEAEFVRTGRIDPNAWASGDRLWIVDLIAPYHGLAGGMARWIRQPGNFTDGMFRFQRFENDKKPPRIVEIDFRRPHSISRVWDREEFPTG